MKERAKFQSVPRPLRLLSWCLALLQAILPIYQELLIAGMFAAATAVPRSASAATPREVKVGSQRPQARAIPSSSQSPAWPYPSFSPEPTDAEFFLAPVLGGPLVPATGPKR